MSDTDDREWLDTLAGQIARARGSNGALDKMDPAVDAAALEGNPFDRKGPTCRTAMGATGTRGWAAAALAVAVLLLGWHLSPQPSTSELARTSLDGIVRLESPQPQALRQQIVAELGAVGVQANGYAQL